MYKNLNLQNLENEIWKPVVGLKNFYEVSNFGRIKSIAGKKQCKNGVIYKIPVKILKQSFTTTGYLKIKLHGKDYKVHRLVASAFIPKIKNKNIINHKDCNPLNNFVSNLEWCTQKENVQHHMANKRNSKINYDIHQQEENIIKLYVFGKTAKEISKQFNVSISTIHNIISKHKTTRREFGNYITKYNINLNQLLLDFQKNISNYELSKKYNCPANLIARRKYQLKKGELRICKNL